jgi:hypothetical protein
MDDIVKKAMAKWPDVPDCYGWLALDARGAWRMRDERAQALGLAGDKVTQTALRGFINRNYMADAAGRWYFQNGPQRVFINLEATPYIVRTVPGGGFVLHTDEAVTQINAAWITPAGRIVLDCDGRIALLEDRDTSECLAQLRLDGAPLDEERMLAWLDGAPGSLTLLQAGRVVDVHRLADENLAQRFGFIALPAND